MVFPIGLATKLKDRQWASYGLIFISCFIFFFVQQFSSVNKEISKIHKENMESKVVSKLYLEYCIRRVVDRKHCLFSKPFFLLKRKKRAIEAKSGSFKEVIEDMGDSYQGTTHYVEFYRKLLAKDRTVKNLPSYSEYLEEQKTHLKKAYDVHRNYLTLSKGNNSFFVVLVSSLSSISIFHLLWNIGIFLVFAKYIEKRIGMIGFILGSAFFNFLILKIYAQSLSPDSIQYVVGSTVFTSFILGFFYISFFYYRLKFFVWKIKTISFYLIKVRYILPVFFIIQEVGLHYLSPVSLPHRANFFAVIIGMIAAQLFKMKVNLPKGFLFESELKEWHWLKAQEDKNLYLNGSCILLQNNPLNMTIREDVFNVIKEKVESGDNINFYIHYLDSILPFYISQKKNLINRPDEVLDILKIIPVDISYAKYFEDTKKRHLVKLINFLRTTKHPKVALKTIQVLYEKFPNAKELDKAKDIFQNIVRALKDDAEITELVYKMAHSSSSLKFRDLCISYIDSE